MFLLFWPWGMWDLSSQTRDQTHTPCIGRRSLNHWTARKVPKSGILNLNLILSQKQHYDSKLGQRFTEITISTLTSFVRVATSCCFLPPPPVWFTGHPKLRISKAKLLIFHANLSQCFCKCHLGPHSSSIQKLWGIIPDPPLFLPSPHLLTLTTVDTQPLTKFCWVCL